MTTDRVETDPRLPYWYQCDNCGYTTDDPPLNSDGDEVLCGRCGGKDIRSIRKVAEAVK